MKKHSKKEILKNIIAYQLSKVAPKNFKILINLKNGIKYIVRARTMDRSVIKEVWLENIYANNDIKVEKGDTVIDIGAHIGVFSIYAAELSQTGKVYAFEPFIDNFAMLEKHKAINKKDNLLVYNKGVSNTSGTQTLYLSPDNNTGGHSLHLKNFSSKTIDIKTVTLKSFCDTERIDKIDFLKMDCEGSEFEIIQSDESILQRVNKLIMECHPYNGNTVQKMVSTLETNGFKVTRKSNNSPEGIEMLYAIK